MIKKVVNSEKFMSFREFEIASTSYIQTCLQEKFLENNDERLKLVSEILFSLERGDSLIFDQKTVDYLDDFLIKERIEFVSNNYDFEKLDETQKVICIEKISEQAYKFKNTKRKITTFGIKNEI